MRHLALTALFLAACSSTTTTTVTGSDAGDGDDAGWTVKRDSGTDAEADSGETVADAGTDADADASAGLFSTCAPDETPTGCPPFVKVDGYEAENVLCFSSHNDPDNPPNDIYGRCVFPCGIDATTKEDPQRSAMCRELGGTCRPIVANGAWWCTPTP